MSECEQISKRATWVRGGRDSQDTVEQKQTKDAPSIKSPLRIPVRVEDFLVGCIFGQVVPATAAGRVSPGDSAGRGRATKGDVLPLLQLFKKKLPSYDKHRRRKGKEKKKKESGE